MNHEERRYGGSVNSSDLFDDIVYGSDPLQNIATKTATQPLEEGNIMKNILQLKESEGGNVTSHIIELTTKQYEYGYAEPVEVTKVKYDGDHLYDSADRLSHRQTSIQVISITNSEKSNSTNGGADSTKCAYHDLETPEKSPDGHNMPLAHLSTTVQDTTQTTDCDSALYKCQFDDPIYESNPQLLANLKVITTQSSMTADPFSVVTESQENGLTTQDNPELLLHHNGEADGDAENYADAPQYSDPTDLESVDNTTGVLDNQDKGDANLASIYDIFDDPTYGAGHTGSNRQ